MRSVRQRHPRRGVKSKQYSVRAKIDVLQRVDDRAFVVAKNQKEARRMATKIFKRRGARRVKVEKVERAS